MTYEEAKKQIERMMHEADEEGSIIPNEMDIEAFNIACEAMELQVAKKIKKIKVGGNGIEYTKYICPSCNSVIKAAPSSWQFMESCCCKVCGQKLEGSEE